MDVVLVRWPEENLHLGELRGVRDPPTAARRARRRAAGLDGSARGLDPAPRRGPGRPGPGRHARGPRIERPGRARDRRRRAPALPGPLGLAVAGRARARRHARRAVRRGRRARADGPTRVAVRARRPATRSTCTSSGCAAASRRSDWRSAPSGRGATSCRSPLPDPVRTPVRAGPSGEGSCTTPCGGGLGVGAMRRPHAMRSRRRGS